MPKMFTCSLLLFAVCLWLFTSLANAQSSTPRVIAEAFQCDENLLELPPTTPPREIGQTIQICIKPNMPTELRDVRMRSIIEFGFLMEGTNITQMVIQNGRSTNEELTIAICVPGSKICSLKTQLLPDFHEYLAEGTIGEVAALGTVTFVQTDGNRRLRGLVQWHSQSSQKEQRSLQIQDDSSGAYQDFAGDHTTKFYIPILPGKRDSRSDVVEDSSDGAMNVWNSLPEWAQIAIPVVLGILVLISILLCLFCVKDFLCPPKAKSTTSQRTNLGSDSSHPGIVEVVRIPSIPSPLRSVKSVKSIKSFPSQRSIHSQMSPGKSPRSSNSKKMLQSQRSGKSVFSQSSPKPQNSLQFPDWSLHSRQTQQSDTEKGPLSRDICFNSKEKWPGTDAFFRAVRKSETAFDEWSPDAATHVKQQLLSRKFYVWEENDDMSSGGYWRRMTSKQVNLKIKKSFKRPNKRQSSKKLKKDTSKHEMGSPKKKKEASKGPESP
jgi:hypothetical protein